jgi:ABC-type dipeptide/oligopeptide/nickel transport system permease component
LDLGHSYSRLYPIAELVHQTILPSRFVIISAIIELAIGVSTVIFEVLREYFDVSHIFATVRTLQYAIPTCDCDVEEIW